MNDTLHRLVYVSRNLIDGDPAAVSAEIGAILDVARRLNAEEEVTGALMFNDGRFAQVLEGPLDAVQETFERIQCDERHDDVRLLALEPVAERGFSSWSMAYVGQDEAARHAFAALAAEGGALDPGALPPERLFELLREHLDEADALAVRRAA